MAKKDLKGYSKIEGSGFSEKFEFKKKGDSIEGIVIDKREVEFTKKKKLETARFLEIETEKGKKSVGVSASMRAFYEKVEIGQKVYMEMVGTMDTGNVQPMKIIDCYISNAKPKNQVVKKK